MESKSLISDYPEDQDGFFVKETNFGLSTSTKEPIYIAYPNKFPICSIQMDNPGSMDGRGKELYGGEYENYYLCCTWKNGVKNGEGLLYDEYDELRFRGEFVDDCIDGEGYFYEDGAVVMQCHYSKNMMNPRCYIEYTNEYIAMVTRNAEGLVTYRGSFNIENNEREGYGAAYEKGILSYFGKYEGNMLVQRIKSFDNDIMYEYNENEDIIYIGGYKDCLAEYFPRNGEGREFVDGIMTFHGSFKNGKRHGRGTEFYHHGVACRKGEWENGVLTNSQELDEHGFFKGLKFDGRMNLPFRTINGCEIISQSIVEFTTGNNMFNHMESLEICNKPKLTSIVIMGRCFTNVHTFTVENCDVLKSIRIADDCFTIYDRSENRPGTTEDCKEMKHMQNSCCITNCNNLNSIEFGLGSFSSFTCLVLNCF